MDSNGHLQILKCFVKSFTSIVMAGQEQHFLLVFEQFELKPWLDKARKANAILVERYGYSKCTPHIDMF